MRAIAMNTIEETKAITSLDVKSDALAELLSGTLTHVLPAKDLNAALNSVALEVSEGKLIARATDRYRLIEGSVESTGELVHSLISESDVKKILTLLKEYKIPVNVTISRVGDLLSVSVLGNSITIRIDDHNYPTLDNFNGLLTYELPRELIGKIYFNPKFFSDYAKIVGNKEGVRVEFRADNKPMDIKLIGVNVEWRALLMPMRTK
jgi:DNA polymerase III sliding clamp (beta) subunit (PCNA family)